MSAAPPDNGRMEILLADANVLIDLLYKPTQHLVLCGSSRCCAGS